MMRIETHPMAGLAVRYYGFSLFDLTKYQRIRSESLPKGTLTAGTKEFTLPSDRLDQVGASALWVFVSQSAIF